MRYLTEVTTNFVLARSLHVAGAAVQVDSVVSDENIPLLLSRMLSRHLSAAVRVADCDQELRQVQSERDRALDELARVSAEASGLHQKLVDAQELARSRDQSSGAEFAKLQAEFNAAVDLNEKQNALAITLEAKVLNLTARL